MEKPIQRQKYLLVFSGEIMAEGIYQGDEISSIYGSPTFLASWISSDGVCWASLYWPESWIKKTENIKIW